MLQAHTSPGSHPVLRVAIIATLVAVGLSSPMALVAQSEGWVVGIWQGTLNAGGQELQIVYHLSADDDGALTGSMDVPAQGAHGLALRDIGVDGTKVSLSFDVPGGGRFEGSRSEKGEEIDGTFSQGPSSFPLTLRRAESTPAPPKRPQEPQAPLPYDSEDVTFAHEAADIKLAGTVTTPRGSGPFPGVVLLSGGGPHDRDGLMAGHKTLLVLADHLTRHGLAVLRFDDRGTASSEGDFASATSEDLAGDALAAIDFLGKRASVDGSRTGFIAHSQGGVAAILAAGQPEPGDESDRPAFLVLLASPVLSAIDSLESRARQAAGAGAATPAAVQGRLQVKMVRAALAADDPEIAVTRMREAAKAVVDSLPEALEARADEIVPDSLIDRIIQQLSLPAMRSNLRIDPRAILETVTIPTLALFGSKDETVSLDPHGPAIVAALDQAGNADATLQTLAGLNHLFQEAEVGGMQHSPTIEQTFAPKALDTISSWITTRFLHP